MQGYTPEQVTTIRAAIVEGYEAMRQQGKFEPLVFAHAFIGHGGIQIPGKPANEKARRKVAQQLLRSLETGGRTSKDATVVREVNRAQMEAQWAAAAVSDKVVGFRITLSPNAQANPNCLAIVGADHGLGEAVFRKLEIVILPPECDGYTITPVLEDEVEQ